MKYLTQATYHSPGSKADRAPAGGTIGGQSYSDVDGGSAGLALHMAAADSIESPGMLLMLQGYSSCLVTCLWTMTIHNLLMLLTMYRVPYAICAVCTAFDT